MTPIELLRKFFAFSPEITDEQIVIMVFEQYVRMEERLLVIEKAMKTFSNSTKPE